MESRRVFFVAHVRGGCRNTEMDPPLNQILIFQVILEPCFYYAKQSLYGIFAYIYHKNQPNVCKYTLHGWYGYIHLVVPMLGGCGRFLLPWRWANLMSFSRKLVGGIHRNSGISMLTICLP